MIFIMQIIIQSYSNYVYINSNQNIYDLDPFWNNILEWFYIYLFHWKAIATVWSIYIHVSIVQKNLDIANQIRLLV